jgi:hypothetical protein
MKQVTVELRFEVDEQQERDLIDKARALYPDGIDAFSSGKTIHLSAEELIEDAGIAAQELAEHYFDELIPGEQPVVISSEATEPIPVGAGTLKELERIVRRPRRR